MKKERVVATVGVVAAAVAVCALRAAAVLGEVHLRDAAARRPAGLRHRAGPDHARSSYKPGPAGAAGRRAAAAGQPRPGAASCSSSKGRCSEAEQVVQALQRAALSPIRRRSISSTWPSEMRDSAKKQYDEKKKEFDRLTITAPAAGTIIPPPSRKRQDQRRRRDACRRGQARRSIQKNLGALLTPTDLICQIGDPADVDAVLIVDQAYIDLVRRKGSTCACCSKPTRAQAYDSKIEEIASNGGEGRLAGHVDAGRRPPGNQDRSRPARCGR